MCIYTYEDDSSCNLLQYLKTKHLKKAIDSKGYCVFHSENHKWKQENDFFKHFQTLISQIEFQDLEGVVFVAEKEKQNIDYLGDISDYDLSKTVFLDPVKIKNQTFTQEIHYTDISFSKMVFEDCVFEQGVILEEFTTDVEKQSVLTFTNCTFQSFVGIHEMSKALHITFEKCIFESSFTFSDSILESGSVMIDSTFKLDFKIVSCDFKNSMVSLSNSIFESDFILQENSFYDTLLLENMDCREQVSFKGSVENKMFLSQVKLDIPDTLASDTYYYFDQVNLLKIEAKTRQRIQELETFNQATIGLGCIKYRHQSPVKVISIQKGYQELIKEIADSFTRYFIDFSQINLGVEIVSRTEDQIKLFYYTDANIKAKIFKRALAQAEFSYLYLLHQNKEQIGLQELENKSLPVFNAKLSLCKVLLNASYHIDQGNWEVQDTKALLETVCSAKIKDEDWEMTHEYLKGVNAQNLLEKLASSFHNTTTVLQIGKYNVYGEKINDGIHFHKK